MRYTGGSFGSVRLPEEPQGSGFKDAAWKPHGNRPAWGGTPAWKPCGADCENGWPREILYAPFLRKGEAKHPLPEGEGTFVLKILRQSVRPLHKNHRTASL